MTTQNIFCLPDHTNFLYSSSLLNSGLTSTSPTFPTFTCFQIHPSQLDRKRLKLTIKIYLVTRTLAFFL